MTSAVTEAGLVFTDPAAYADEDRLHEAFALLRRRTRCTGWRRWASSRSGLSPVTLTSCTSSGTTSCSSTRPGRC